MVLFAELLVLITIITILIDILIIITSTYWFYVVGYQDILEVFWHKIYIGVELPLWEIEGFTIKEARLTFSSPQINHVM